LKAVWTPEFAQDLAAYQNIDAEAELTNIMSEYISMEIDLEILDMLIEDAAALLSTGQLLTTQFTTQQLVLLLLLHFKLSTTLKVSGSKL
jgi:hypothetical protein